jgi:hypothetical protein
MKTTACQDKYVPEFVCAGWLRCGKEKMEERRLRREEERIRKNIRLFFSALLLFLAS